MSILKIENLNLERISDKSILIKDISIEIESGDVVLVSGRNGVGKTSFINALLNNMAIDGSGYAQLSGEFEVAGRAPDKRLFERVIYIPQSDYISFSFVTVYDALSYACPVGKKKRAEYLNTWLLKYSPFTIDDEKKKILKKRIGNLSGGEKKYVAILQSLLRCDEEKIKFIILDEPINSLDENHVRMLSNLLLKIKNKNPRIGFLLVSHCHAFPYISSTYEIKQFQFQKGEYCKGTCFGEFDNDGFYFM